jgi:predicted ATPase/DNA-binding CsgD family transcriptional regulator
MSTPGGLHGFVPALTSFVGRDDEVSGVADLLGTYRLVTVTGPGGMGKTRLAGEVARVVAPRFADGARLVELAPVQEPGQVPAAVATGLGIPAVPGQPAAGTLAAALSGQQILIVLDNCEHVLAAVAELCGALLPRADDVRILATSREPVGMAGEARFRLLPLPVLPAATDSAQEIPAAARLFADRARQADPRFVMDGDSMPLVKRLVERLDGMPLAIELAAARVEVLGLAQLADRFGDNLQLLTNADRGAAERHRSLAATVDWSYRLLSGPEQQVFRQLGIFPGPFTLDAAVTVAGTGTETAILHLVDCSLLSPPRPGADGRARFSMPQTVRAFAASQLDDSGERPEAQAALARHAVAVAEQAAAGMRTSDEAAAMRLLDAEDAAVQQALGWALEHDPGSALRLAVSLAKWWVFRGRLETGRAMLLAAADHAVPGSEDWCVAQFWLGDIGPAALSLHHETAAIRALAAKGPSTLLPELLAGRSRTLAYLGRVPEAAEDARQALNVAREISYPAGVVLALAQLSRTAHYAGDTAAALDWARQAQRALASQDVGWTLQYTGSFISEVLIESGDLAAARSSLADQLDWARQAGDRIGQVSGLRLTADLELRAGDLAESGAHLREATELTAVTGAQQWLLPPCLDLCAHWCAARGRQAEAVTLWAAFQAHLEANGSADTPLAAQRRRPPLAQATAALGSARTQEARQRGAAMTIQTAAEFARMVIGADLPNPAQPGSQSGTTQLSAREQELIGLVARGQTDTQIAAQLYISVSTVRSHLDRIRDKTGFRRRADLTRLALRNGLI